MKVLNIGCSKRHMANDPRVKYFEAEILDMDIDPANEPDILQDITKPIAEELHGQFDVVWASHVLEHVSRADLGQVMRNFTELLKSGGELWVFVPSMEWACREILAGNEHLAIQMLIFGGQNDEWDYHRMGFTQDALGFLLQKFDLEKVQIGQGTFAIVTGEGKYQVCQNVVCGVKK